jgi:hypothetical protein
MNVLEIANEPLDSWNKEIAFSSFFLSIDIKPFLLCLTIGAKLRHPLNNHLQFNSSLPAYPSHVSIDPLSISVLLFFWSGRPSLLPMLIVHLVLSIEE